MKVLSVVSLIILWIGLYEVPSWQAISAERGATRGDEPPSPSPRPTLLAELYLS